MFLFFLGHGFEAPLAAGSSNGRHLLEKVVLVLSALSSAGGAAVAESLASLVPSCIYIITAMIVFP